MRCLSLVGLSSLVCGGSASVPRDHDAAPADGKRNRADQANLRTHYGRTRSITRRHHSLETVEERAEGATARQSTRTPSAIDEHRDLRVREHFDRLAAEDDRRDTTTPV